MAKYFCKRSLVWLKVCLLFVVVVVGCLSPTHAQDGATVIDRRSAVDAYQELDPEVQDILKEEHGFNLQDDFVVDVEDQGIDEKSVDTPAARKNEEKQKEGGGEGEGSKLKRFGFELFSSSAKTLTPNADIPVPQGYVLGPGDSLRVNYYGKLNKVFNLEVNRDGVAEVPELGPINVAGMTFERFSTLLNDRISQSKIGVAASVSLRRLRSVRVFVLGEVKNPGSYIVSPLSTMTNALLQSGGIQDVGSLRSVKLKRNGKTVADLDLYELLLKGDTSSDSKIEPGDVIFVPPVGRTVSVEGGVLRPAIYELRREDTLHELVEMAGGLSADIWPDRVLISRLNESGKRDLLETDLKGQLGRDFRLRDGDEVTLFHALSVKTGFVKVSGHVYRPGEHAWKKGLRLSDVVTSDSVKPGVDMSFAVLMRQAMSSRSNLEIVYFAPSSIVLGGDDNYDGYADIDLRPGDHVIMLPFSSKSAPDRRKQELNRVIEEIRRATNVTHELAAVELFGASRVAGRYPLPSTAFFASDLIVDYSHLEKGADRDNALVLSFNEESASYSVRKFSITKALENPLSDLDPRLDPGDEIYVLPARGQEAGQRRLELIASILSRLDQFSSEYGVSRTVSVRGEVRFPGDYPIHQGMDVRDLVELAGGLSINAVESDAELNRRVLVNGVHGSKKSIDYSSLQVDLAKEFSVALGSATRLRPGDILRINKIPGAYEPRFAEIAGEVVYPGVYRVSGSESIRTLIARAGGLKPSANLEAASLSRKFLREKERKQLDALSERIRKELIIKSTADERSSDIAQEISLLVEAVREAKVTGRLVVDFESQLSGASEQIRLEDGDKLVIPKADETVTVAGEIQVPTSHQHREKKNTQYYIERSGGLTSLADDRRIFVIEPTGEVYRAKRGFFFARRKVNPGSIIVVPPDVDAADPLERLRLITDIVSQVGFSLAAFNSVGVFD